MRTWMGVALLAGSWLLGLHFYQPASWIAWTAVVALGVGCLSGFPVRLPQRPESLLAAVLVVPAVCFFAWPYRAAPLLLAAGLLLRCVRVPQRWPTPLARGLVASGLVLLTQSVVMELYAAHTARTHELPWPWPDLVGAIAQLLGADATVDGSSLVLGSLRGPLRLGVTWELVFDPVTLAFLAGGATLLALTAGRGAAGSESGNVEASKSLRSGFRQFGRLAAAIVVWLPVRTAFLLALLLHRTALWDAADRYNVMDQFLSPWVHLVLLAAPAVAARCFVGALAPASDAGEAAAPRLAGWRSVREAASLASVLAAMGALAWLWHWDPVGERLPGRIMVVERHSTWEPTTRPYDTASFGEDSSYTYAAIYDYCSRFYEMSRLLESDRIDDARLAACDVLVIKTPTEAYSDEEVAAIRQFVDRGGGLFLIGEHTDVFKSSTFLNAIAKSFGFRFRMDLLFNIGDPYVQEYQPPRVPHPIVQHVPRMRFAVSCSIDPGSSSGRAAVLSTGLWNMPPEYHTENFFPEPEYRPESRYGAFVQLWTTRHGSGRVAAWTDSTIFSNFSAFEPGKTELMLGTLEWLNRRSTLDRAEMRWGVSALLGLLATAVLGGGIYASMRQRISVLAVLGAGLCGVVVGSVVVVAAQRQAMPVPKPVRPMVRVMVDRTVSDVPLSRGGFTQEDGLGYGLLEQWIPRLGYFTARRSGQAAFDGDVLVVIAPQRSVSEEYRKGLVEFVAGGGKLLVLDSPEVSGSTANSLLWPFGLAINHSESRRGKLALAGGWPGIDLENVCEVAGGDAFMWVERLPVAARVSHGRGRVMAVGFGSLMNDNGLGGHWMAETTPDMLTRSGLLFALVRALVSDEPVAPPALREGAPKKTTISTAPTENK